MLKAIIFTAICLLSCSVNSNAQLFENGDRVCFVGNSITHGGDFHHNIMQYYVTRFPDRNVTFFNCGISGDVTGGVMKRLDSDVLINKPSHVVIMIGMNDVKGALYKPYIVLNVDTLQKREAALQLYRQNLDSIVSYLISKKVKLILQKPSIYDETGELPCETSLGWNNALKSCADFMQTLADKYKLQTIDYWSIMTDLNLKIQSTNPTATIVGNDRIHPGIPGHLVMAYQFLKTTKSPGFVSNILISNHNKQTQSTNCSIRKVKYSKRGVRFIVKENALPFIFTESQKPALELVPFVEDLNKEMLQVEDLVAGNYKIVIDTCVVGIFSNVELQRGINLALNAKTPQYFQSLNVNKKLTQLWDNERKLRGITHFEFMDLRNFKNKTDFALSVAYIETVYTKKFPDNKGIKVRFENYKINKPKQRSLEKLSDELRVEIYKLAQPIKHSYSLVMEKKRL